MGQFFWLQKDEATLFLLDIVEARWSNTKYLCDQYILAVWWSSIWRCDFGYTIRGNNEDIEITLVSFFRMWLKIDQLGKKILVSEL